MARLLGSRQPEVPHDADELRLIEIAWRLDRLRWVPTECWPSRARQRRVHVARPWTTAPEWLDQQQTDRELAARLCGGCPVQDECLELELRTAGDQTVGVWGALTEDDRRALYPHWLRRGERAEDRRRGHERHHPDADEVLGRCRCA